METGLSSNAAPAVTGFPLALSALVLLAMPMMLAPLAAQDETTATPPAADAEPSVAQPQPPRINLMVTVPRGEVNQAQAQECEDRADAGTISGEIVVCRAIGDDGSNALSSSREEAQKRYAQETMLKGGARAPEAFGIPDNGKGIGFGGVPPPAVFIDVEALPKAPAGSDADRIARGLPPLREDAELTEEEEKARREALGIKTTLPPRPKQN